MGENQKGEVRSLRWLTWVLPPALLMAGAIGVYWFKFGELLSDDRNEWGTLGDYLGGVLNPLFSLFAFVAVIYSMHLQAKSASTADAKAKEQLQLAREELQATKVAQQAQDILSVLHQIMEDIRALASRKHRGKEDPETGSFIYFDMNDAIRFAHELESDPEDESLARFAKRSANEELGRTAKTIGYHVAALRHMLERYEVVRAWPDHPFTLYYADRILPYEKALRFLNAPVEPGTWEFFHKARGAVDPSQLNMVVSPASTTGPR